MKGKLKNSNYTMRQYNQWNLVPHFIKFCGKTNRCHPEAQRGIFRLGKDSRRTGFLAALEMTTGKIF